MHSLCHGCDLRKIKNVNYRAAAIFALNAILFRMKQMSTGTAIAILTVLLLVMLAIINYTPPLMRMQ